MEIRQTYLAMIRAASGGWDVMCAALGYSRDALENRIYEKKGQSLLVETAMQMQHFSGTTLFAEWVAKQSGGVFMKLPESVECDKQELLSKFNELYAELGALSAKFNDYTADDEIKPGERSDLEDVGQHIHRTVEELLALTFQTFCRKDQKTKAVD